MTRNLQIYQEVPYLAVETGDTAFLDKSCKKCALHAGTKTVCMGPEQIRSSGGPGRLLVVIDHPTKKDDEIGAPARSESGGTLRYLTRQYWKGEIIIDTALRCAPASRKVRPGMIDKCRPYLAQTVAESGATRVIAMGAQALYAVTGRAIPPLSVRRGFTWLMGPPIIPVFEMMSPVAATMNRFMRKFYEEDLKWACTVDPLSLPQNSYDGIVKILETEEDARNTVEWARAQRFIAYDFESAGQQYETGTQEGRPPFRPLCVSIASPDEEDVWGWDEPALRAPHLREAFRVIAEDPKILKAGQNEKFDRHCSEHLGIDVRGVSFDCRFMRKLIDAESKASLAVMQELIGFGGAKNEMGAALAKVNKRAMAKPTVKDPERGSQEYLLKHFGEEGLPYANAIRNKTGKDKHQKWSYALADPDIVLRYNAMDSRSTAVLADHIDKEIKTIPNANRVWNDLTSRQINAVAQIEAWGIYVDREQVEAFQALTMLRRDDSEMHILRLAEELGIGTIGRTKETRSKPSRPIPFSPSKPAHITELLYTRLKLRPAKFTESGKPSTDKEALELVRKAHSIVGHILDWRKVDKKKGTYADAYSRFIRSDGRMHPNYNPDGARSGRMSSSEPNCFTADSELLTKRGWVRFDALAEDDLFAQWEENGRVSFQPGNIIQQHFAGDLVHLNNEHIDLLVTPDHRCPLVNRKTGELRVFSAETYKDDWRQVHAGRYVDGTTHLEPAVITLLCATQADGSWSKYGVDFSFKKKHKYERLVAALTAHGVEFSDYTNITRYRVLVRDDAMNRWLRDMLGGEKTFSTWITNFDEATLLRFVQEVKHWDNSDHNYVSTKPINCDMVQIAYLLTSTRAIVVDYPYSYRDDKRISFTLSPLVPRDYSLTTNIARSRVAHDGLVYCVSVPSSYIIVRRNGKPCVTGNCFNIPRVDPKAPEGKMARDCFAAPPDHVLIEWDMGQVELREAAIESGDENMRQIFLDGDDYHLRTAEMVAKTAWGVTDPSSVSEELWKDYRSKAKNINFGVLYGMGDFALSKRINTTPEEAGLIKTAIMGNFPKLARFIKDAVREAETTGGVFTYWEGKPFRWRPLWRVADKGDDSGSARSQATNASYNTKIQGKANDRVLFALTRIVEWILAEEIDHLVKVVLSVYDSIILEVHESMIDTVNIVVPQIMLDGAEHNRGVPVTVDGSIGTSWGSMKKIGERSTHPAKAGAKE